MYKVFASGIGSMIAVMIMFNSLFAEQAGYLLSILITHLVGLLAVSLILRALTPFLVVLSRA